MTKSGVSVRDLLGEMTSLVELSDGDTAAPDINKKHLLRYVQMLHTFVGALHEAGALQGSPASSKVLKALRSAMTDVEPARADAMVRVYKSLARQGKLGERK